MRGSPGRAEHTWCRDWREHHRSAGVCFDGRHVRTSRWRQTSCSRSDLVIDHHGLDHLGLAARSAGSAGTCRRRRWCSSPSPRARAVWWRGRLQRRDRAAHRALPERPLHRRRAGHPGRHRLGQGQPAARAGGGASACGPGPGPMRADRDLFVQDLHAGADPAPPAARAGDHRDRLAQPVRAQHVPRAAARGAARISSPTSPCSSCPGLHADPATGTAPARPSRSCSTSSRRTHPDLRHPLRRRDQEVDLHRAQLSLAGRGRVADALLGQRRRARRRRALLRPLRHRQDHALGRPDAHADRRRRARLGRERRVQFRGRLLRQGDRSVGRGRAARSTPPRPASARSSRTSSPIR